MNTEEITTNLLTEAIEDDMLTMPDTKMDLIDLDLESPAETYKIKYFELLKINPDSNKLAIHCWCQKPVVKMPNGQFQCGWLDPKFAATTKKFCGLKLDINAVSFYLKKAGFVKQDSEKKYFVKFPQCSKCCYCNLTMSSNKKYPNLYGNLVFSCNCDYIKDKRMSLKVTIPPFNQYLNEHIYEQIRDSLVQNEPSNKKQRTNGILAELEPLQPTVMD